MTLDGIPEEKLTPDEEFRLAQSINPEDKQKLVMHNLREAFFYATGCYQSKSLSPGEVLSVCFEALSRAVRPFKPGSTRFFAYAKQEIRGALSKSRKAQFSIPEECLDTAPEDTDEDPEDDPEVFPRLKKIAARNIASIEPEFSAICLRDEWESLRPILKQALSKKEQAVLELYYTGQLDFKQIAELLDVSMSYIQHLKQRALVRLRNELIAQGRFFNRE